MKEKNVLFILVDCLRADRCSEPRKNKYSTPFIDQLINGGTSFTQAISVTSFTNPSVASILTGVYPFIHGVEWFSGIKINPTQPILAEVLKKADYTTCAMVTGPLIPNLGFERGFDYYYYRDERKTVYSGFRESLEEKLRTLKTPWFLFVHLWELHYPIYLPQDLEIKYGLSFDKYDKALSCLDHELLSIFGEIDLDKTIIVFLSDHGERLPSQSESIQRNLLGFFKKRISNPQTWFKLSKTLFSLFPGMKTKQGHGFHLYDTLVRVPLIFMGGDFPKGTSIERQVSHVDIFPTILDSLGLMAENDFETNGQSLVPLIKGLDEQLRAHYIGPAGIVDGLGHDRSKWIKGIRTEKWKFISTYSQNRPVELYNLMLDPLELKNLVNVEKQIVHKFREDLRILDGNHMTHRRMTKQEQEKIEEKLRALGYID